jgi:MFS family permease
MSKRQLFALCACNFIIYTGLAALVALMPVYLTRLGADSGVTGFFLAFAYLALAVSNVIMGRLSDRLQRRKSLLVLAGALSVPVTWLMSQAASVLPLLLLMVATFFLMGTVLMMVNILIGLFSEAGRRERVFGILNLSESMGLFFGALVSGPVVNRWGFPGLFTLLAAFYLLTPAAALLAQDKQVERPTQAQANLSAIREIFANRTFLLLFVASILAQAANSISFMSRALKMDALHFDPAAISTASAVGSLMTMPLPLLVGWLATRVGRKPVLVACFIGVPLGLLFLALATDMWQFWAASLLSTTVGVSIVIGSAIVTDSFPQATLGTALSLLNATPWIGIVIGLSGGGVAIRVLQMTPALILAMALGMAGLLLLLPIPARQPDYEMDAA